jgi:hypothetical protein
VDKSEQSNNIVPQSHFVTILAWIFIVLTAFATFISILQNIMIGWFFPLEKVQQGFSQPDAKEHLPVFMTFMSSHIRIIFISFLALSSTGFASSIGLLKRRNWARIVISILLFLGILLNVVGVFLQQIMLSSIPKIPQQYKSQMLQFESMMEVIKIFTIVTAISLSILFVWIIKKLNKPAIRAEFTT